jgi:hypothetical protein
MEKADNRGVAEGEDGYFNGTTGLPVGIHFGHHDQLPVARDATLSTYPWMSHFRSKPDAAM